MIDKQRTNRALRRSLIGLVAVLALAVPALASATVFEGSQTDPLGDVLISALPSIDLPNGGPPSTGFGTMDLTGVSVSYDSSVGLLSITYYGSNFVYTHSGTSFYGAIQSAAHAGPGQCRSANDNLYFNGTSGTGSGGGPGHGTATLNISSDDNPILAKQITGTVSFPVDFPEHNQVATFTFLDNGLRNHAYLCAAYLDANYKDHGDSNVDNTSAFCIVRGCFDPLGSATPPPGGPPTGTASTGGVTTSASPGPTVVAAQGTSIDARCSILPGKIKATTARMRLMQRASHKGSASHRRAVTRQVRVLTSRRTTQRATYKALCTAAAATFASISSR